MCGRKNSYLLLLLAVSYHCCLIWAAFNKDMNSHLETSVMGSGSELIRRVFSVNHPTQYQKGDSKTSHERFK